ncbi:MAG: hypothetical protein IT449_07545 [Phycisphaerales bacterium]|nr:hypothetical protein [Phycisphaerales bacterium]
MATQHDMIGPVYVVVDVMSGTAAGAACFSTEADAIAYAGALRREADPNDDDVQVFARVIDSERPTG